MKILCFDVESNGLYGEGFAVGAVLLGADGKLLNSFKGRAEIGGPIDSWVAQNVLPALSEVPVTHTTVRSLHREFREWFLTVSPGAYVFVDCGYPVETRFLEVVHEENGDLMPKPLLDVSTLLLAAGKDPWHTKRNEYLSELNAPMYHPVGSPHDPFYDAGVSAVCAWKLLQEFEHNRSRTGEFRSEFDECCGRYG